MKLREAEYVKGYIKSIRYDLEVVGAASTAAPLLGQPR